MKTTILTTTYNRCQLLSKLYMSLQKQTNKNFEWLIIDDGSNDETEITVKQWITNKQEFPIRYIRKQNGGKSRAVNLGINNVSDSKFIIIIDDDEVLYNNAMAIVNEYVDKYNNTNCGAIEFLRNGEDGKPIANYILDEDFYMNVQERKRRNLSIDGYAGYFVDKLGDLRFPEFDNERYVGPGVLQMLIGKKYELLWPNKVLGETEYLEGGITKSGRRLRLRNPKGMLIHCVLLQDKESGFKIRFKYSVMGYAYIYYSGQEEEHFYHEGIECYKFLKVAKLPGVILGMYWKKKYSKSE